MTSNIEELERLAQLRREGVVSEEEFNAFKAGLLSPAAAGDAPGGGLNIQEMSDRIADVIGVERIEGFEGRSFFADLFKKRTPGEVEEHFAFGFPGNVPAPETIPAEWPRPWSFMRVLLSGALLFGVFVVSYDLFENNNLVPGLILTGSFAAPVAMVVFFYEMNILRNISIYHLARLFLLGGVMALFAALLIDSFVPLSSVFGAPAAGVTEEVAKLAIVIAAMRMMRLGGKAYILNGMLIGATIGAGFAAFESAGYAFRVLTGEVQGATVLDIIVERGVLSPFGHIAWTAIAAGALWKVAGGPTFSWDELKRPDFLRLFGLAVMLHALWDTAFDPPFLSKFLVLGAVAWVAVLSLLQSGIKQLKVHHA